MSTNSQIRAEAPGLVKRALAHGDTLAQRLEDDLNAERDLCARWRSAAIDCGAIALGLLILEFPKLMLIAAFLFLGAGVVVGGVFYMLWRHDEAAEEREIAGEPQCDWPCCECTVCHRDCGGTCME